MPLCFAMPGSNVHCSMLAFGHGIPGSLRPGPSCLWVPFPTHGTKRISILERLGTLAKICSSPDLPNGKQFPLTLRLKDSCRLGHVDLDQTIFSLPVAKSVPQGHSTHDKRSPCNRRFQCHFLWHLPIERSTIAKHCQHELRCSRSMRNLFVQKTMNLANRNLSRAGRTFRCIDVIPMAVHTIG